MGIFENANLLTKEAQAVMTLRDNLKELGLLDEDNLAIAIESETGLKEVVEQFLIAESEECADQAKQDLLIKQYQERKAASKKRCETMRRLLLVAFEQAEIQKIPTAYGTASLKKVPMGVEVVEEGELPSQYWKLPDPVVDKTKLKTDAVAREKAICEAKAQAQGSDGKLDAKLLKQLMKKIDAEHPAIPGIEIVPETVTISVRK